MTPAPTTSGDIDPPLAAEALVFAREVGEWLGDDGPLVRRLTGFAPREAQRRMGEAVGGVIVAHDTLLVEAGTGTGKTFAYLVPALLSGQRVVVSTGTRNLQDQLYARDLPRLLDALQVSARVALLKGRANYLCLYRLGRTGQTPGWRFDERVDRLSSWSKSTESGDLTGFAGLPDNDPLHARVTSTADNCLGAKCPDYAACFVVKARRAAQSADLVVVNHHLLLADFALKQEGFGELLPGADAVILDEAHQIPDLATQFFGTRVSTRQLRDLADDAIREAEEWGDLPDLVAAAEQLSGHAIGLESELSGLAQRATLDRLLARPAAGERLTALGQALEAFRTMSAAVAERAAGLAALEDRAKAVQQRLTVVTTPPPSGDSRVRWVEPRGRGGSLHATPVDVAEEFGQMRRAHPGAWILTSATLSTSGDFSHLKGQLGLANARTLTLESPFDYAQQARLYLPRSLPEPNTPHYAASVADHLAPLIRASAGGAFVLCTSHRALRVIAERLFRALEADALDLFVQGDAPRAELVERFAASGRGVLVGTASFWEGVDVRGRALRLVAIDRLPFAAPGDPVFDARLDAIRQAGGSPFVDYQLPEAITMLRQGVGRLIRDGSDRGLLVICDPRIASKGYGRRIVASLPPMPIVDLEQALGWAATL